VKNLVLSIFPGIDLLGRAFEEEGYCVVRGPDPLWGGNIKRFHPPAGVFEGVIGGPPCQVFSSMRHLLRHQGHEPKFGNLIPEFERVVAEVSPRWFIMENVPDAPTPEVIGYFTKEIIIRDKWVGGTQPRPRKISFGTKTGTILDIEWSLLMRPEAESGFTITAGHSLTPAARRSVLGSGVGVHGGGRADGFPGGHWPGAGRQNIEDACEAMGLPPDFTKEMPFTIHGKRQVIGNGVPLPMGRALAKAVRRATE